MAICFLVKSPVFANEGEKILTEINTISSNATVSGMGGVLAQLFGSVYSALASISVISCVIALVIGFIKLALCNGNLRVAAKSYIMWVCFALILIGMSTGLVSIFLSIGKVLK